MLKKLHRKRAGAFTLVETMIVVALIADLCVIAIPNFQRARRTAQNARLVSDMRIMTEALGVYAAENMRYPAEAATGVTPAGMANYLRTASFSAPNAIGGLWDWDYNQGYAKAALCIVLPSAGDTIQMTDIDRRIDNGILATGAFRERTTSRYAYILE